MGTAPDYESRRLVERLYWETMEEIALLVKVLSTNLHRALLTRMTRPSFKWILWMWEKLVGKVTTWRKLDLIEGWMHYLHQWLFWKSLWQTAILRLHPNAPLSGIEAWGVCIWLLELTDMQKMLLMCILLMTNWIRIMYSYYRFYYTYTHRISWIFHNQILLYASKRHAFS